MSTAKWLLSICFVIVGTQLQAQSDLKVQGSTPELYLMHNVVAKETWYSVGRLYNLSPGKIAAFNKTTMDNGLQIGQQLRIPLIKANFSQDGKRDADEVFVPVYYTVQAREWMYRVSTEHNKVPIANLESWNNIKNDDLRPGMDLVVGYLKVRPGQSALAARGSKRIITAASPPVAKNDPAPQTGLQNRQEEKVTEKVMASETKDVSQNKPVTVQPAVQNTSSPATGSFEGYRGGYFKSTFKGKGVNSSGNAGIFRSTSGWKDGKYYALINDVPVGTIIRVTFPSTRKSIYAKVLGQLPEMKESIGLILRLSDAAATELGAERGKFYVEVKW